jgi:hypothetical protein
MRVVVLLLPRCCFGASSSNRPQGRSTIRTFLAVAAFLFSFASTATRGRFVGASTPPGDSGCFGFLAAAAAVTEGLETQVGFRLVRIARAGGVRAAARLEEGAAAAAAGGMETQAGLRLTRNARPDEVRSPPARRGGQSGGGRTVDSMAGRGRDREG